MSKRHREGKTWEKAVVYAVAFIWFAGFYTWAQVRIGPENASIPTQWLAVGISLVEGLLGGLMAYQVLEFRHARRARRRERRLKETMARIHFPR